MHTCSGTPGKISPFYAGSALDVATSQEEEVRWFESRLVSPFFILCMRARLPWRTINLQFEVACLNWFNFHDQVWKLQRALGNRAWSRVLQPALCVISLRQSKDILACNFVWAPRFRKRRVVLSSLNFSPFAFLLSITAFFSRTSCRTFQHCFMNVVATSKRFAPSHLAKRDSWTETMVHARLCHTTK